MSAPNSETARRFFGAWRYLGSVIDGKPRADRANPVGIIIYDPSGHMAVQIVRGRELSQVGHHPHSKETFEPVTGVAVICVAPNDAPDDLAAFVLDRPVVVNAGVWHGLIALSREAIVKIAENRVMTGENRPLTRPLRVGLLPG